MKMLDETRKKLSIQKLKLLKLFDLFWLSSLNSNNMNDNLFYKDIIKYYMQNNKDKEWVE